MRIDDQIERLVRNALDATVKEDGDRLDTALAAFPDAASRGGGLQLAVTICGFVVIEAYEGRPSVEEIRLLAEEMAGMSEWAGLSTDEVSTYLDSVLSGRPIDGELDPETATRLTFIVTGCLLASSDKVGEGEWWFNYLDRVEAAIEATPEP